MRIFLITLAVFYFTETALGQQRHSLPAPQTPARLTAECPPNIGFENGDFGNWNCYIGTNAESAGQNMIILSPSPPLPRRHELQNSNGLDPYGLFPVRPPLGGQYTLKLGNDTVGSGAERVRYVINVPPNDPNYSITFQYAVVLENPDQSQGGAHTDQEQPRFTAKLYDPQTNEYISCGSFTFVASLVGVIPGFAVSSTLGGPWSSPPAKVWYKPWSSVFVDLSNYGGRTLYLEFTTGDCTKYGHFGYAYVDVFACGVGAVASYTCGPQDTITLKAPDGFKTYKWYNNDFSTLYGSIQQIKIIPSHPSNGTYNVVVTPYNNTDCSSCDCSDTLSVTPPFPKITGELLAPPGDMLCPGEKITLSATGGVRYQWYRDNVLQPGSTAETILATAPGTYSVDIFNTEGCKIRAQQNVQLKTPPKPIPDFIADTVCIHTPVLFQNKSISPTPTEYYWDFGDASPKVNTFQPMHSYMLPNRYFVKLIAKSAQCSILKDSLVKPVNVVTPGPNQRYPIVNASRNEAQNLSSRPGATKYSWLPTNGLNNPQTESPKFMNDRSQEYTIQLRWANGCTNVDTLLVRIFAQKNIYVPTAFSPNGDGYNDHIYPILTGAIQLKSFRVFSRWGSLLFESSNPSSIVGWDGKWNNTNQPMDTYTWIAEVVTQSGETIKRSGNFVLIR